jgi:predicted Zn-dependent protease
MKKNLFLAGILLFATILFSCNKEDGFNLFSLDKEKELGLQMKNEIISKPTEYPLLDKTKYADAYAHLNSIKDKVLNTGAVNHKADFSWEVFIINDDKVVNAFATPGGYLYFYTGLIKNLDNEAQFAGVMSHEMAHAALRHSTKQLQLTYGLSILSDIVLGKESGSLTSMVKDLALGLGTLKFSRTHEYEADEYAVKYLYKTNYNAPSLADFFDKLNSSKTSSWSPEFLSTHPDPGNRVEKIKEVWNSLGGKTGATYQNEYQSFKGMLP